MNNNNTKGIGRRIFEALLFVMGFLLFVPTGLLLLVAMFAVYGNDWAQLAIFILWTVGLSVLVGITALVPSRLFAMLGMLIAELTLASFGSGVVTTALAQMPPSLGWLGTIGMSAALVITHTALWLAVRNFNKPATAKPINPASASIKPA